MSQSPKGLCQLQPHFGTIGLINSDGSMQGRTLGARCAGLESQAILSGLKGSRKVARDGIPTHSNPSCDSRDGEHIQTGFFSHPNEDTPNGTCTTPRDLLYSLALTSWSWLLVTVQGEERARSPSTCVCPAGRPSGSFHPHNNCLKVRVSL